MKIRQIEHLAYAQTDRTILQFLQLSAFNDCTRTLSYSGFPLRQRQI